MRDADVPPHAPYLPPMAQDGCLRGPGGQCPNSWREAQNQKPRSNGFGFGVCAWMEVARHSRLINAPKRARLLASVGLD